MNKAFQENHNRSREWTTEEKKEKKVTEKKEKKVTEKSTKKCAPKKKETPAKTTSKQTDKQGLLTLFQVFMNTACVVLFVTNTN